MTENQDKAMYAIIQRLATLSPLQYDKIRKAEAEALGVRPGTLDATVKNARKGNTIDDLPFTEVDAWPETVNPTALSALSNGVLWGNLLLIFG